LFHFKAIKASRLSSIIEEYLDQLAEKVLWTLSAIKLTHPAPSVYLKKMVATDDLWEVRVVFSGNIFPCWAGWKAWTNWSLPAPRLMPQCLGLIPV